MLPGPVHAGPCGEWPLRLVSARLFEFGAEDPDYDRLFLPKGFVSAVYTLPHRLLCNGCGILALQEDTMGVMFSEILITKKENLQ